jgi:hypothetical protein
MQIKNNLNLFLIIFCTFQAKFIINKIKMKYIYFALFLSCIVTTTNAQNETQFDVVPKQFSAEIGYRYNFSNSFDIKPNTGYSLLLDYAWQLSGFESKSAAYISVPLGYTSFASKDSVYSLLSYGWTVRHVLSKNKKLNPFIGYSLLLNQMRISGVEGSVMGHKTGLGFGINFGSKSRLIPYLRCEYSYSSFGTLGTKTKEKMQAFEVCAGVRI